MAYSCRYQIHIFVWIYTSLYTGLHVAPKGNPYTANVFNKPDTVYWVLCMIIYSECRKVTWRHVHSIYYELKMQYISILHNQTFITLHPNVWYTVFRGYFICKQYANDRYAVRSNVMFLVSIPHFCMKRQRVLRKKTTITYKSNNVLF